MEYFNPTDSIKRARNINRIIMLTSYIIANVAWVLWLNQVFNGDDNGQSGNIDGLVYLPALFATPIITLLFVPPFVWAGSVWQSTKLQTELEESKVIIWAHMQPILNLILSPVSILACLILSVIALFFARA